MQLRVSDFEFEKIFLAWEKIEAYGIKDVEAQLQQFRQICNDYVDVVIKDFDHYGPFHNVYIEHYMETIPIITGFFKEVREISEEAYQFISEGYDIVKLEDYLEFEEKDSQEMTKLLFGLKTFSIFIEHAFMKILNETDVDKKRVMLRGLVGM